MSKNTTSQLIYAGSRRVGSVHGGIFQKTVQGSRHFIRYPCPAIALSLDTLNQAEELGARMIEITDGETGRVYLTSLENFRARAYEINYTDRQLSMPLIEWTTSLKVKSEAPKRGEVRRAPGKVQRTRKLKTWQPGLPGLQESKI